MSPIYWGTYAPEMETALKQGDFTGKKIRVITTHEGSGIANTINDVKKVCPGAIVSDDGLAIKGLQAKESKNTLKNWL